MKIMREFSFLVMLLLTAMTLVPLIAAEYSAEETIIESDDQIDVTGPSSSPGMCQGFTENKGQWDEQLDFMAPTSFGHIGFGDGEAYLDMVSGRDAGYVLGYEFLNSNGVEPEGQDELGYRTNYFYGNDPSLWRTDIRNYGSIVYEDLWTDIDLRYYLSNVGLKYEFILAPGADPDDIRIKVDGIEEIIAEDDRLEFILPDGFPSMVDDSLSVFYSDNNEPIDARFSRISCDIFGFELDNIDKGNEVIIDPFIYSTYIGGSNNDECKSLDVDSSGNSYLTGTTASSNFPTTTGAYNRTKHNNVDVFVMKMNPSGSNLVYSTFIGSDSSDYGEGIVIDTSGNAYVTGYTYEVWSGGNGTNGTTPYYFPTTSGAYDPTQNGNYDVFILKLDPSGSSLIYSTLVGSTNNEYGMDIDLDSSGNAYVTGYTQSSQFPTTTGAFSTSSSGGSDPFALKLNSSGARLLYSTYLGGSSTDEALALSVDSSGNAYVTGRTTSTDFPTTSGAYDTSHNSGRDVFLTKVNSTGKGLSYSTYIGGASSDTGWDVEVDANGNAYVTGNTYYYYSGGNGSGNSSTSNFPVTSGSYDRSHNGQEDCFVFKMNSAGSSLLFSTYIGGSSDDYGMGLSIDSNGMVVVTGYTYSSNFPTVWGSLDTSQNGRYDIFVSRLTSTGAALNYSTFVGGSAYDSGVGVHHISTKYVIVAGYTTSSNYPTTNGAYDTSYNSNYDGFLFKMDFDISAPPIAPTNLNGTINSDHVALSWNPPVNTGTAPLIGYKVYRMAMNGSGGNRSVWFSLYRTIGAVSSWQDFGITIGNDYYYYLVAYNSVGDSPDSSWVYVTDRTSPLFIVDTTPTTCYSGERLTFQTSVFDDVKVRSVELTYWHPGQMPRTSMMIRSDTFNWTSDLDLFLDIPGTMFYKFRARDYYDNLRDSEESTIRIISGRPYFITDSTPTEGTTGESLEFKIEVKDNTGVSTVCVEYWYGSGSTTNSTMSMASSDIWSYTITLEDTIHTLKYLFHAKDDRGHWNQTRFEQVQVLDNDAPMITLDETPASANTGEQLMFLVTVDDNIEVNMVNVEYWFGDGYHSNITLEEWSSDQWRVAINIPEDDLSSLNYIFWVKDERGNTVTGPQKTVTVNDNILPELITDSTSGHAYTGAPFRFQARITDNIEVSEVWVEYWLTGESRTNRSATEATDLYWELTVPVPHILKDLNYEFHIRDSSGNWQTTGAGNVVVKDKVKPRILEDRTPTTVNTGDHLIFEVVVDDNIHTSLVMVEYWFGNKAKFNITMEGTVSNTLQILIDIDEDEDIQYVIHVMDTSQNWNQTPLMLVDVIDDDLPEFTGDTTLSSGEGGTKFTISTYADDNIGLEEVRVEYWFDEAEHQNVTMIGSDPFRLIIDLPEEGGILYYRFHATDVNDNHFVTDIVDVEVSEKGGGTPDDDDDDDDDTTPVDDDDDDDVISPGDDNKMPSWLWVLIVVIIILFVLTVVNIGVMVMRRKKPEEPDEQPAMQEPQPQQPWPPSYVQYQQQPAPQYQTQPEEEGSFPVPEPVPEPQYESIPLEQEPAIEESPPVEPVQQIEEPPVVDQVPSVEEPPAIEEVSPSEEPPEPSESVENPVPEENTDQVPQEPSN